MAKVQTNPRYKSFTQAVFTAGDEEQFESSIPRLGPTRRDDVVDLSANIFSDKLSLYSWDQLAIDLYRNLTSSDVYNTFLYLFYKFKKGIYVNLHDGRVASFLPFSNATFRNEWSSLIRIDGTRYRNVQELLDRVSSLSGYRPQRALPVNEWQANDGMFRYEIQRYEGDNNVVILRDMFETLARERRIPDSEFYVNRRDFPLLKQDGTEPYFNLYGSANRPLVSHSYDGYAPILSCSTATGFADLPIPTYEDWARIQWQKSGRAFPNSHRRYPAIVQKSWESKRSVAVFRGSSTGSGVTVKTNQRLRALAIAESPENAGRLDVGITSWNLRPRKHASSRFLETIERNSYPVANKLTLQEQADSYKYVLTLEGHVAAYRLSYELSSGSVVLLAGSRWRMWFYKFLKPYVHFVPIKEDLSDLLDKVDWCRSNDARCRAIADSAREFYRVYLGETGALDYLQRLLVDVAADVGTYSWLPNLRNLAASNEKEWVLEHQSSSSSHLSGDGTGFPFRMAPGPRCVGRLDAARIVLLDRGGKADFIRNVVVSKTVAVDLMETNGFQFVRKTPLNDSKKIEAAHEIYVGLNAVNKLVSKCPNFAYVHGLFDDKVCVEYIPGVTLATWLASPRYNFKDYVSILIQLNLAFAVGQNYAAFVHYDAYPWNVIVQTIPDEVTFCYNVGNGLLYAYKTRVIPVLIDYGRSRAVVYDARYGLVDSCFINMYRAAISIDTLSLLYSTIKILLNNRLTDRQYEFLLNYSKFLPGYDDVPYLSRYGVLIRLVTSHVDPRSFGPLDFVSYVQSSEFTDANLSATGALDLRMSRGLPALELEFMNTGDYGLALRETIAKINRRTIPASSDAVTSALIANLIRRRVGELDERVSRSDDERLKSSYAVVRKLLTTKRKKIETETIVLDFPSVRQLQLGAEMSPQFVAEYLPLVQSVPEDWLIIWEVCAEASLTERALDIFSVLRSDAYEFFSRVASNNTLRAIASRVESIRGSDIGSVNTD